MNKNLRSFLYGVGIAASTSLAGLASTKIQDINHIEKYKIENQAPCPFGQLPTQDELMAPHKKYSREEVEEIIPAVYECLPNKPDYLTQELVEAVIQQESQYKNWAHSNVNARGLTQLMESTWKEHTKAVYGDTLPFDLAYVPRINLETGFKYITWLDKYASKKHPNWDNLTSKQKIEIIAAAYHGGPTSLNSKNWNVELMGPKTRKYSNKIKSFANN